MNTLPLYNTFNKYWEQKGRFIFTKKDPDAELLPDPDSIYFSTTNILNRRFLVSISFIPAKLAAVLMALSIVPPPIAVSIVRRAIGAVTVAVPAVLLFAVTCQRHSCHQRHQSGKQARFLGRGAVYLLPRPEFVLPIQGSDPGLSGDLPEESIASGEEGGTSNPPLT